MKPREVLAMCREKEVKAVDLRFTDFLGPGSTSRSR
jgi:glutamine synthetase